MHELLHPKVYAYVLRLLAKMVKYVTQLLNLNNELL